MVLALFCAAASQAQAACTINDVGNSGGAGPFTNTTAIDCINIQNSTVNGGTGNVTNANTGSINSTAFPRADVPVGITINNSTLTGGVINNGSIMAVGTFGGGTGISIFQNSSVSGAIINNSTITVGSAGISDGVDGFGIPSSAGIVNNGTITVTSAFGSGISASAVTSFTGGISNSNTGTIFAPVGITVGDMPSFSGGISNSGIITGDGGAPAILGIGVSTGVVGAAPMSFSGGISNSGTITAGFGIQVQANSANITITGDINNSNAINAQNGFGQIGIDIQGSPSLFGNPVYAITVNGNIINSGTITAGTGIELQSYSTVQGSILNSGNMQATTTGILIDNTSGVMSTDTAIKITGTTFTGGISNAGFLSGTNTGIGITGVTTYSGGIANTGTITGTNTSGISVANVTTFSGNISNNGGITGTTGVTIGTGVGFSPGSALVNFGAITGTGGTAIDASQATSAVTMNQNAGTVTGAIKLSANADVLNISGGVINGNIVGQGTTNTVNFAPGAGNGFIYASPFGFGGVNQVNVNSGIVVLDGNNSATSVAVNSGATLAGTGTVASVMSVNSGGTFAPGNGTPGSSMAVNGSLAFQSGATYLVQVNPTTASFAAVTGAAALGGATVNAAFANGSYISKKYTILTTTGGVSGTFGALTNTNLPSNFTDTLSYDANNAYLNLTLGFVPNYGSGLNINQTNVANALVKYFNTNGGIPMIYGALSPAGLTQASGELATASQQTTFDAMGQLMGLLTDPFMNRGGGSATPSGIGYADEGLAYSGTRTHDAYAMFSKAPFAQVYDPHWSVWAAGFGGTQSTSGNAVLGSNTTTSNIAATAVGADYLLSPSTIAGFALAGGGTSFGVNGSGSGRSDLFQAAAYARHTEGSAYVSAALAYGWQDITTNRTLTVAGLDQLRAEFNANAWSGRLEGGYRYVSPLAGGIGITPYAAAQFVTFALPAYAEQVVAGTSNFALAYGAKDVTDARTELGIRSDKSWVTTSGVLTLRGRFAWAHDYDPDRSIAATFQALPGASFVVNGATQAADSALTTASLEMQWKSGWSAGATFEGEFSRVTSSYAGKGVVRFVW